MEGSCWLQENLHTFFQSREILAQAGLRCRNKHNFCVSLKLQIRCHSGPSFRTFAQVTQKTNCQFSNFNPLKESFFKPFQFSCFYLWPKAVSNMFAWFGKKTRREKEHKAWPKHASAPLPLAARRSEASGQMVEGVVLLGSQTSLGHSPDK